MPNRRSPKAGRGVAHALADTGPGEALEAHERRDRVAGQTEDGHAVQDTEGEGLGDGDGEGVGVGVGVESPLLVLVSRSDGPVAQKLSHEVTMRSGSRIRLFIEPPQEQGRQWASQSHPATGACRRG